MSDTTCKKVYDNTCSKATQIFIKEIKNTNGEEIIYLPKPYLGGYPDVEKFYAKGVIRVTPSQQFKDEWLFIKCFNCNTNVQTKGYHDRYRKVQYLNGTMISHRRIQLNHSLQKR